ncbi:TBC1 domain family member 30 isoform X1 [Scomber scombrus]|uniref:TBC1 domain family member 30 isoform X1 n=1 Tax=Scomber scombrus TaxID=13677 RepID=UPI002DDC563F|nr:TBC1 domain family member 30 isoform X1 [Scomber scombrus]
MATEINLNGSELFEVEVGSGGVISEDGCFVASAASLLDDFSGFQQWSSPAESPTDTSPPLAQWERGDVAATTFQKNNNNNSDSELYADGLRAQRSSIVDCLLVELYETYSGGSRRNVDSWDSSTEASGSDAFLGRSNSGSGFLLELQEKHTRRHQMNYLAQKAPEELHSIIQEVKYRTGLQSAKLLRQLKRRDRLCNKLQKNYDIITACLQAVSQKRRVDTRLKFTIEPSLGKNGFQQWYDALKAVARLPTGIPKEWRKRVWLTLADQYLHSISIDWEKTLRFAFNERSNPDDDSLGIQIVKDLHRTGCSSYCGQEGEQDRVVLKRVLLAYARWNKAVGYCQGFNVLAALILEVTEGNESDALKVMIYLIDKVLPESYFANNLRALSVDMAVFRDVLRLKLPRLSQHLHHLQKAANREAGGSYEPPLTNVFTMQWFLTMFATCLPAATVLKIWDSVFFEGSEVLFRAALAIWERLGERIEYCQTADDFYSTMGCLTQEMLERNLIDPVELMQEVYSMAVFPFPQLAELREKYTYNITPFPTSVKSNGSGGLGGWESDDDADMDDEDSVVTALGCLGPLGGLLAPELHRYQKHLKDQRSETGNIAELSPGAVGAVGQGSGGGGGSAGGGARAEHQAAINSMMMERMSTDIHALKKQYTRIKRRQQQQAMQLYIRTGPGPEVATSPGVLQELSNKHSDVSDHQTDDKCPATRVMASQLNSSSTVINHLLLGRKQCEGPWGSRPTSTSTSTLPGAQLTSLSQTQGSPCRQRCGSNSSGSPGSSGGGTGSPWRAHVRVHRRNVARAREQLGFGDSEEREEEDEDEDKEEEGEKGSVDETNMKIEEEEGDDEEEKEGAEEQYDSSVPPSPDPSGTGSVCEKAPQVEDVTKEAEVGDVVVRLGSLDLDCELDQTSSSNTNLDTQPTPPESKPAPVVPLLPPPPSSNRHKESDSSGSERNTDSDRQSPSITLHPPHPFSSSCIPSSSPSTPSPSLSPVPTSASVDLSCTSSPTPPSTPTPHSTSRLPSSLSVNGLSNLSTPTSSTFYKTSSPSMGSLSSVASSSGSRISSSPSTPAFPSTSTSKQQIYSPFPSVKQPRKSAAARNLGLYGPTSRTPTVHFPQLSRNLNRSSAAGTTGRR